jgi:hypothetical protein
MPGPCSVLSCPVLSCPVMSCPSLSCGRRDVRSAVGGAAVRSLTAPQCGCRTAPTVLDKRGAGAPGDQHLRCRDARASNNSDTKSYSSQTSEEKGICRIIPREKVIIRKIIEDQSYFSRDAPGRLRAHTDIRSGTFCEENLTLCTLSIL